MDLAWIETRYPTATGKSGGIFGGGIKNDKGFALQDFTI
jgi:hypothetical protein